MVHKVIYPTYMHSYGIADCFAVTNLDGYAHRDKQCRLERWYSMAGKLSHLSTRQKVGLAIAVVFLLVSVVASGSALAQNSSTGRPDPNGFVKNVFHAVVTPNPTEVARSYQEWQELLKHQDSSAASNPSNH